MSKLVKDRGGFDLLPEMGFKPVNKYLPPRARRDAATAAISGPAQRPSEPRSTTSPLEKLFAFADKIFRDDLLDKPATLRKRACIPPTPSFSSRPCPAPDMAFLRGSRLLAIFDKVRPDFAIGLFGLGLAFALIIAGLLSSTAHLGRPERAWRAFSQWQTSWLSREGVAAVATFVPAGLFAIGWVFFATHSHIFSLMALATIAGALVTTACTGMIYQSLPTIRAWSDGLVTPIYVVLALATGGVLLLWVLRLFEIAPHTTALGVSALLLLALVLKVLYWRRIDSAKKTWTAGAATGLGALGSIRVLDAPHTQDNYIMREMGYQVARKHASRLRTIAIGMTFALPLFMTMMSLAVPPSTALIFATLAVVFCALGIFVERWLFFAEAQHVVTLYYGAEVA